MITHLHIKDVSLIDEVEVSFGSGLNVLTGETGAGKSIVVDSINFMLGERPTRDFLRSGAESASVEGLVSVRQQDCDTALRTLGLEIGDGQLMLQRSLNAQGKSVCRVNGRVVTVGMLKDISALLVDVHGQHEHQSLLDNRKQLQLLDQFCGNELVQLKRQLEDLLRKYRANGKSIRGLSGFGNDRENQLEIWRYQTDEINKAKLSLGEEDELLIRRARLNGLEKLSQNTSEALSLLNGGDGTAGISDMVSRVVSLVNEIGRLDPSRKSLSGSINEAAVILSDTAADLRNYEDELDADPRELERVETRLDILYRLKKKYGATVEAVLKHAEQTQEKIDKLLGSDEALKHLNHERRTLAKEIAAVCGLMSALRKAQAEQIQGQVAGILTELGMKKARFEIQLEQKEMFGPDGNNEVHFMIAPNPGEPLKPLNRIASGGEMSRIMLAIKTVMADFDGIETLIFDEIDAGVSGRTAQQVAEKLMGISRGRQILCITHLPQIAAMADTHFLIEKETLGERTVTSVRAQDRDGTIKELARLIGGAEITPATVKAAGEMKDLADALKRGI